jgi:DNA-binding NtrC family response regulator
VRVVAATNRRPADAVAEGRIRQDLLFRLDVLRVTVPSLRERLEDIPVLVSHFLAECAARYGTQGSSMGEAALERLRAHDWPGNVRELRNVIERAFVAAGPATVIEPEILDLGVLAPIDNDLGAPHHGIVIPHGATAASAERIVILETLKATGNNKAEAARRLGLDVKTIRNKLKSFENGGPVE